MAARGDHARSSSVASASSSLCRRTAAIPNAKGTKAFYINYTQTPDTLAKITETRLLDLESGTSALFSNDPCDKEVQWLGKSDQVVWLKEVVAGTTEIWIAEAPEVESRCVDLHLEIGLNAHCAGRIAAKATHLKVKRLYNEYDDIAIAVACPASSNGSLWNPEADHSVTGGSEVQNAIWYTTLRKKASESNSNETRYLISPSKFVNALRGTGLESPLSAPHGTPDDFDISCSGIVFLAKDATGGSVNFPSINVYYIPLKTFTEVSRPRPQMISVRDYDGRSSIPVFSPTGASLAFLKKKHPIDQNDRNRIIVINSIRDFRAHLSNDDLPSVRQSEKDWHLSPYTLAWSDNGKELYVVAVDQGIRKLFKLPAAVSSIQITPEPITHASTTPADVKHLRMVFSAPMESVSRAACS